MKIFDRLGLIFLLFVISFGCFSSSIIISIMGLVNKTREYIKIDTILLVMGWITLLLGRYLLKKEKE